MIACLSRRTIGKVPSVPRWSGIARTTISGRLLRRQRLLDSIVLACLLALCASFNGDAAPPTVRCPSSADGDQWLKTGTIRVGYRVDAKPFSSRLSGTTASESSTEGETFANLTGYSIDLCNRVLDTIKQELDRKPCEEVKEFTMAAYPVFTFSPNMDAGSGVEQNATEPRFSRFERLTEKAPVHQRLDMLCGATSMTVDRMLEVDFSLMTFITGASFLYTVDQSFETLKDL